MRMLVRLGVLAAALALGAWLWFTLFPSPEKIVRQRVQKVAQSISFAANEGNLSRFAKVRELAGYFALDAKLYFDTTEIGRISLAGREEIEQVAMGTRSRLSSLEVKFIDVNVTLGVDRESAVTELTARVSARGDENFFVQELRFTFKKIKGNWLITRVETVKTLR